MSNSDIKVWLIFFAVLFMFIIPVAFQIILQLVFRWNEKNYKEVQRSYKEQSNREIEDYWEKTAQPYYEETREMFKTLMKLGALDHKEIKVFKSILDDSLGMVVSKYKNYEWENDAKEIYTKLKNKYLFKSDYELMLSFLNNKYENSPLVTPKKVVQLKSKSS